MQRAEARWPVVTADSGTESRTREWHVFCLGRLRHAPTGLELDMRLATVAMMGMCSVLGLGACADTTDSVGEGVEQASQPIQDMMNGVCSTTNEVSAEFMRAAIRELGG